MDFEILSKISDIEPIAVAGQIRDIAKLRRKYGAGRWRKLKGIATIRLRNGRVRVAELHWYEAHGIGRKEMKRKRYLD
ncbi:MAG: hypothetical protein DMF70_12705 [Acidobacteria bacterium]|nr:MAG: hypothetical protein DMF70_12705 [Acidobacteriota bacterium]